MSFARDPFISGRFGETIREVVFGKRLRILGLFPTIWLKINDNTSIDETTLIKVRRNVPLRRVPLLLSS